MKRFVFLLLVIAISTVTNTFSQDNNKCKISGKVFDSKTKKPMGDVNVYLAGTLHGSTTDANGDFSISKIPIGNYNLVVSRIGYEPVVISIMLFDETPIEKTFYLKEKVYDIDEVTVNAEEPDKWKDQLARFKKYFFGQTGFSADCEIENEYDLNFEEGESGELTAKSENPLTIINKNLGFEIYCELAAFKYSPGTQIVHSLYYPYFRELNPENESESREWSKNRKYACFLSLNRVLIALAKSSYRLKEYRFAKCEGFAFDCEPIHPEQIDVKFNPESGLYTISFPFHLGIKNRITGNESYISLPYGYAQFNKYGFVKRAYSIEVIGEFAKLGISTALPCEFYDDILISDYLERM